LHLSWIDKLLENATTLFVASYKDQLQSPRSRVQNYPFDRFFDQQIEELENSGAGAKIAQSTGVLEGDKKDVLVSSDNGGPPPPSLPSAKGTQIL
jgi:signal recognition particle receptor subunit alpha